MVRPARELRIFALIAFVATLTSGCLEKPEIEDRWTRLDIKDTNVRSGQTMQAGVSESVSVNTTITYRKIVTGFAVAELRASSTISAGGVSLRPDAPRTAMAADIDRILANSVSVGRAVRPVTGWDHLIQPVAFSFRAIPQATVDSSGVSIGPTTGLFLVCYLGSGERLELAGGRDSTVVTPFPSSQYEILPIGLELTVMP